jgi:hypothetical protein
MLKFNNFTGTFYANENAKYVSNPNASVAPFYGAVLECGTNRVVTYSVPRVQPMEADADGKIHLYEMEYPLSAVPVKTPEDLLPIAYNEDFAKKTGKNSFLQLGDFKWELLKKLSDSGAVISGS